MTAPASVSEAELVDQLASRVNRLGLSRISPEDWHAEKSDVASALRRLAKRLRGDIDREPTTTWRP